MNENLTTIASFVDPIQAQIAKSKLETEGIESLLLNEHLISINWNLSNALGGVKLQVKNSDKDRAQAILTEKIEWSDEMKNNIGDGGNRIICPECHSSDVYFDKFSRPIAFISLLLLGVPLPFLKKMKYKTGTVLIYLVQFHEDHS